MRTHKPLMAYILWSDNIMDTGTANSNCQQILRLFVYLVHLQYPEAYITTMMVSRYSVIIKLKSSNTWKNAVRLTSLFFYLFCNQLFTRLDLLYNNSIISVLYDLSGWWVSQPRCERFNSQCRTMFAWFFKCLFRVCALWHPLHRILVWDQNYAYETVGCSFKFLK